MARNIPTKSKIALELELADQDQEVLSTASGESGLVPFVKSCVEAYLHEYANGGLLLTGQEVARIGKAGKADVSKSDDVVSLVEKAQRSNKGLRTFQITLDPSLIDSFQQNADFKGVSVDELLQECWNHIHANGWLYQMQPDVLWIPLSGKELAKIKETAPEAAVTSRDVIELLRKASA